MLKRIIFLFAVANALRRPEWWGDFVLDQIINEQLDDIIAISHETGVKLSGNSDFIDWI
jgi:hypothetical protein